MTLLERASMHATPRSKAGPEGWKKRCLSLCAASALFLGVATFPAQAQGPSNAPLAEWEKYADELGQAGPATFERLQMAAKVARAVERSSDQSGLAMALAKKVTDAIASSYPNLGNYPRLVRVHGHEEPSWLSDRGDATAQAVIALSALERWKPEATRRELLTKLAQGLAALQRKDRLEYPFGAHVSWEDREPMATLDDGTRVPSAYFRTDHAYAVEALAEASEVLRDKELLLSAEREALGMSTHLVIAGKPIASFSPEPEFSTHPNNNISLARGFLALHRVTKKELYADLAALTTIWVGGRVSDVNPEWKPLLAEIAATKAERWLRAQASGDPISFQVMEAEAGKVVNKAIETLGFQTPYNGRGTLAAMGRENTFWMRFDVPTEDDYVFYVTYLQSDIGGGLVSVMMRIDGDKIFQVSLGDVDGRPIMRRKFVDGPRPLRAGPHSFGIRFSGLLMTKPALLDSVIVQPAVERREFTLPGGDRAILLRNVTGDTARTDQASFAPWPPKEVLVVNGDGVTAKLGHSEDRRRRKQFITLPAYGVALIVLSPATKEAE